jgi:hypothetical protein
MAAVRLRLVTCVPSWYYPDRGSLIPLITGTNQRGDSHDIVCQSRHRADNLLLCMGKLTRKFRLNRSMSLKGKKSSVVVLWVDGSCSNIKKALRKSRGGDDAIVNLGVVRLGMFRVGHCND